MNEKEFFDPRKSWNRIPESIARETDHDKEFVELLNLNEKDIYLDVGCGYGQGTSFIASKCLRATGVDIDEDRIAFAKKTFNKPNIEFIISDIAKMELKEKFTIAGSKDVFEHISREQGREVLKRVYNALEIGGRFVIHTPTIHRKYLSQLSLEPLVMTEELHKELYKVPPGHCTLHSMRSLINDVWDAGFIIQAAWNGTKVEKNYREEIIARQITQWELYIIARKVE